MRPKSHGWSSGWMPTNDNGILLDLNIHVLCLQAATQDHEQQPAPDQQQTTCRAQSSTEPARPNVGERELKVTSLARTQSKLLLIIMLSAVHLRAHSTMIIRGIQQEDQAESAGILVWLLAMYSKQSQWWRALLTNNRLAQDVQASSTLYLSLIMNQSGFAMAFFLKNLCQTAVGLSDILAQLWRPNECNPRVSVSLYLKGSLEHEFGTPSALPPAPLQSMLTVIVCGQHRGFLSAMCLLTLAIEEDEGRLMLTAARSRRQARPAATAVSHAPSSQTGKGVRLRSRAAPPPSVMQRLPHRPGRQLQISQPSMVTPFSDPKVLLLRLSKLRLATPPRVPDPNPPLLQAGLPASRSMHMAPQLLISMWPMGRPKPSLCLSQWHQADPQQHLCRLPMGIPNPLSLKLVNS